MTEIKLKLFGERNTATRAVGKALRSEPRVKMGFGNTPEMYSNPEFAALEAGIKAHYQTTWSKLYKSAMRDNHFHRVSPLAQWKHAAPEWHRSYVDQGVSVLLLIRNPYSWALSMARRPYHMKAPRTGDMSAFLARPWMCEHRDNCGILHQNLIAFWCSKMNSYLTFEHRAKEYTCPVSFLRFEDFVQDPKKTVERVLGGFGLSDPTVDVQEHSTKRNGDDLNALQAHYQKEEWRKYLRASDVALINKFLDDAILERFSYARLSADDFPDELEEEHATWLRAQMLNLLG